MASSGNILDKSPKIYIAAMNMRGTWAPRPEGSIVLNVTSAQAKDSIYRRDFSPMTMLPEGYKGFPNFEAYWQSGKVYEGFDESQRSKQVSWWKNIKEPKRRYPTAKTAKVLHSDHHDGVKRDYITSRKEVYVPEYYSLTNSRGVESINKVKALIAQGKSICVYDFDGPRDLEGNPICLEVTLDMLREKINDPKYPFGHGYVVSSILANIPIESFI
jgi:hypothetical protein